MLDTDLLDGRRALNLPGYSCTVEEQIDALRRAAGQKVVDLIKPVPDKAIMSMVDGWPRDFDPQLAIELGFVSEANFDEIIAVYIEDDLQR